MEGLYLVLQDNSKRWYARFKVGKKHVTYATGETEPEKAKSKALDEYYKRKAEYQLGITSGAQPFKALAQQVITELELLIAKGKSTKTNQVYIGILRNYHIPFLGDKRIDHINQKEMDSFHLWREQKFGKQLSKSSLQNHNAALAKVYDKALRNGQISQYHIPTFDTDGKKQQRRAAFSWEEFRKISDFIDEERAQTKNKTSMMLLELLYDYIDFVAATGIRPGTEIDNIQWQDIHFQLNNGISEITVAVRKGKTIQHTDTRKIVVRSDYAINLEDLAERFPDRKADDLVFRLRDGSMPKPSALSRKFSEVLDKLNLKNSPWGERTLYSLRHSYITWNLRNKADIPALATQCGTSIEMIDRTYSHLLPSMFRHELSGVITENKIPDPLKPRKPTAKSRIIQTKWYSNFDKNFRERGFI